MLAVGIWHELHMKAEASLGPPYKMWGLPNITCTKGSASNLVAESSQLRKLTGG